MNKNSKKKLISIVGPTAIGKTRMAIALANYFETEIISCDSRQFFKEMCIGTAVPCKEELQAAQHHFIQHKSIFEPYSVGDFEREVIALLSKLFKKYDVVVMVGGSGLYVNAVTNGLDDFPEVPSEVREMVKQNYANQGIEYLQNTLKERDPIQFLKMDTQNPQRMIRAIEVCLSSGQPYSSFLKKNETIRNFDTINIGLTADREVVYHRINQRVEQMLELGLLCEVQRLLPYKNLNALQTVGYKELFGFFEGKFSLDFAIAEMKKNTRRFAKRQYTWFQKNDQIHWIDYQSSAEEVVAIMENKLNR
ncbi:tRNA (adenosine(37)-N6)-dimethylallyltransferase MiaA [Capnocytophaga canimorsus]|uniref:tRNA dimethylallyltransferase n=1 Tax=Capnocytophaga canimorsus (strain 5) TaxID=860228 RepID=F9YVA2_CAPCC|nr:tRNA (adenosine(37)-N6)-dimethylallyltransferase MiaA [Capnocytophaga canimorsus]AEK23147.1 Dimethylallyl diphosphate:tRNA dimethylallyltransferase 1 [Capnocytophaga canimorsus Cc5]CEN45984.1 tRNA dimethylallyltransferase [Capnocytophaga canimorsus]